MLRNILKLWIQYAEKMNMHTHTNTQTNCTYKTICTLNTHTHQMYTHKTYIHQSHTHKTTHTSHTHTHTHTNRSMPNTQTIIIFYFKNLFAFQNPLVWMWRCECTHQSVTAREILLATRTPFLRSSCSVCIKQQKECLQTSSTLISVWPLQMFTTPPEHW